MIHEWFEMNWDILQQPFLETKIRIFFQKDYSFFLESKIFVQNKNLEYSFKKIIMF